MGLLDLPRVGRNYASTVHVAAHGGGGDNYDSLCCCAGCLPCTVYPQLDLPVSFAPFPFASASLFPRYPCNKLYLSSSGRPSSTPSHAALRSKCVKRRRRYFSRFRSYEEYQANWLLIYS